MKEKPIVFKSGGQQVVGMLHLPEKLKAKSPAVLCLHGFTGAKTEAHRMFVKLGRTLAQAGVLCLRIDFRGSGDSEGDFSQMTIARQVEDAHEALKFLRARPDVNTARIGLLGMSMGGMTAALVLSTDKKLKASALWAPVGDPRRLIEARRNASTQQQLDTMGLVDVDGWPIGKAFIDEMMELDPLESVANAKGPILIIHGDRDQTVPLHESRAYVDVLKAAGKKVQYHLISGADHTFNSIAWETELLAITLDWFRTMLR